jgi:hypothetical protein
VTERTATVLVAVSLLVGGVASAEKVSDNGLGADKLNLHLLGRERDRKLAGVLRLRAEATLDAVVNEGNETR